MPSDEADFEAALAIYDDYFGEPLPPDVAASIFWPWELQLLRLHEAGQIDRAAALASWRRLRATFSLMGRCARALGVDVVWEGRNFVAQSRSA